MENFKRGDTVILVNHDKGSSYNSKEQGWNIGDTATVEKGNYKIRRLHSISDSVWIDVKRTKDNYHNSYHPESFTLKKDEGKMRVHTFAFSSVVKRIAYCANCGTLVVKFVKGGVYEYAGVPGSVFENFRNADSGGTFFHSNIKDKFPSKCIVTSGDMYSTNAYNMNDSHTCYQTGVFKSVGNEGKEPWDKLFGKEEGIDVVPTYVVDGETYTSIDDARVARDKLNNKELAKKIKKVLGVSRWDNNEAWISLILEKRNELKNLL